MSQGLIGACLLVSYAYIQDAYIQGLLYDQHVILQETVKYQKTPLYPSKIWGTPKLQLTQFQGDYVNL